MAVKDIFKVNRKTFLDPRAWLGYDYLKFQTLQIYTIIKDLFTPAVPTREETYEQAMERHNLTDADVQKTGQNYYIWGWAFFVLGSFALVFGFLLLISYLTFFGWLLGMATAALLYTQAFRYNFWSFQIKHRKLGCTFAEWKRGKPGSDKDSAV
jgi:intracellular multiplication protein IcmV